ELAQRLEPVGGRVDVVPRLPQELHERRAGVDLVVHDQDAGSALHAHAILPRVDPRRTAPLTRPPRRGDAGPARLAVARAGCARLAFARAGFALCGARRGGPGGGAPGGTAVALHTGPWRRDSCWSSTTRRTRAPRWPSSCGKRVIAWRPLPTGSRLWRRSRSR